ncbi:MAG: hypothetical protein JNM25_17645 [Planctomycetes bacterium]|nr:hypothetical protein [Planctomycetota bacterium]
MHLAIYAHPFDLAALGSHGGLSRLADLGFREIAMATSYHDGRWLQPWNPEARVRFLEDGTVHFRPGADYGVLRPLASSSVPARGPSPLERLCAEAPKAGLRVRAWNVCTHNSRLGLLHPELCIENAFGDRLCYALCPAQPAVQQYVVSMVHDLAGHEGLAAIELEAFGWMGWKHSSHHDKASFVPRGLLDYALSLCFCEPCRTRMQAEDGDPEATRAWALDQIERAVEHADAMAPTPVLDGIDARRWDAGDPATLVAEAAILPARSARIATLAALGRAVRQVVPSGLTCAVQVHPQALFTGSQVPIAQTQGLRADEHVLTAYGESMDGIRKLLAGETMFLLDDPQHRRRLCIWPKAPQFTGDADLEQVRDLAAAHGIGAIAIYHLGLLPWRTIERVARVLTG